METTEKYHSVAFTCIHQTKVTTEQNQYLVVGMIGKMIQKTSFKVISFQNSQQNRTLSTHGFVYLYSYPSITPMIVIREISLSLSIYNRGRVISLGLC